jgi:acetaldehyde dehydrogenase/alcohol dehydrogenase
MLVAVPTTSGTGSEVTPFAVVTDEVTGVKYPIADYELTPHMAIVDANLVMDMPKSLTAFGGIDAVTHALEAYVSVMANEYSDPQALQALKLLKDYLPSAYLNGARDPKAREQCITPPALPASPLPTPSWAYATPWRTSWVRSSAWRMVWPMPC